MIENATNLTTQLESESLGDIILSNLIAFFSAPCVENILLAILIVVTILGVWTAHKRSDFYNRFQEVYKEFLRPDAVKLEYDKTKGLRYTTSGHEGWRDFISIVNKRLKRKWLKYRAPRLYKKVEKAVEICKGCVKALYPEIGSVFVDKLSEKNLNFLILNNKNGKSSEDYIFLDGAALYLDDTISSKKNTSLEIKGGSDGRHMLSYHSTIAKATSETKINSLRDLIEFLRSDKKIKELVEKRDKAKNDAKRLMDKYNDKLAKVIHDLRFCVW